MAADTGYYRNLVEKQEGKGDRSSLALSRNSSFASLGDLDDEDDDDKNMKKKSLAFLLKHTPA